MKKLFYNAKNKERKKMHGLEKSKNKYSILISNMVKPTDTVYLDNSSSESSVIFKRVMGS